MDPQILGYFGALTIGIVLGLLGGGGSILTVPILVYLFYLNPVISTAYSLFVVGVSALIGAIKNIQRRLVDFKTAAVFAIPSFIAVYITRKYIIPIIPNELFTVYEILVTKDLAIMLFFGIVMLLASVYMLTDKSNNLKEEKGQYNLVLLILQGIIVGLITGVIGAGGGFIIIPSLMLFAKMPMKKAVATSLLIIAVKSLIGFIGDVENLDIDWAFLLSFTSISIVGILIGVFLSKFIDGVKLKKIFGWFIFIMAIFILLFETVL